MMREKDKNTHTHKKKPTQTHLPLTFIFITDSNRIQFHLEKTNLSSLVSMLLHNKRYKHAFNNPIITIQTDLNNISFVYYWR